MEIKNVIKNSEKIYPTINQINSKELKKNIPNRWLKLGMSTAIFTFFIPKRVLATKIVPEPLYATFGPGVDDPFNPTLPRVTIVMIILSAFLGIKNKMKKKKESKIMKIIRIIIWVITILLTIKTLQYLKYFNY